ncbi:hypothetical protein MSPP1_000759 [Malassezia sp. CBS 17886]|nr:hypothetical protein MSPP1_000759 [Malassezia sp. CBS 17886]
MTAQNQAFTRAQPSSPKSNADGSFSSFAAMQQAVNEPYAAPLMPTDGTSPPAHIKRSRALSIPSSTRAPRVLQPFGTEEIRILLLENVSQGAANLLRQQGYQVDFQTGAWSEEELVAKIGEYHAVGIRSKTRLTKRVFQAAHNLLVVGCFCIGTNQVDLDAASRSGIAVFNSPFANSRSVAELVIGEMVCLSRQLADRAMEMRQGTWNKVSKQCFEVRGKLLGIVGYGHIGSQLSVLAESMGMHVVYYDVLPLMPLGSARQADTLDELLAEADFVSLHVPELPETRGMIGAAELAKMKEGAYLLNNSRGSVVDLAALADALRNKHLGGCAVDVFPKEPAKNGANTFTSELNPWAADLQQQPNVILTPHIGGSTEEAQRMIGIEVGNALCRYINFGASLGAVNFPEVSLRPITEQETRVIRVCYVHHNQPGALLAVNEILGTHNVDKQISDSLKNIAYLLADISDVSESDIQDIYTRLSKTNACILVTQTVSRLLQGSYLKSPPAWYNATLRHPPALVPPRQTLSRPDNDLPRPLQSGPQARARALALSKHGRSHLNSKKKLRSQLPSLRAQPVVYEADTIRRQFFRDHPWEAKRPATLVEMVYTLDTSPEPHIPEGQMPELHYWSRTNPTAEDSVVQCTLKTCERGNMSLMQAYRRTIAAFHAIRAEREFRIRYAVVEARYWGADLGPSQTDRGFAREEEALREWEALNAGGDGAALKDGASGGARTKRVDSAFTAGHAYLAAARARSAGKGAAAGAAAESPAD